MIQATTFRGWRSAISRPTIAGASHVIAMSTTSPGGIHSSPAIGKSPTT
jgi:hypothetical protein